MAWVPYDNAKLVQYNASANAVDFSTSGSTLKISLHTSAYNAAAGRATHDFFDDVTNEVTGTNYTAGGATLASKTLGVTSNTLTFDCADITWSQSAGGFTTARIAVLYKSTGTPGTSTLVAYYDLGSDKGNVAGDLVLGTPNGIFTV